MLGAVSCGHPSKTIVDEYSLLQFETGQAYYLCKGVECGGETNGILDGEVTRLGWNRDYLIVEMKGPPRLDGWRIIELKSDAVEGPLNDAEFKAAIARRGLTDLLLQSPGLLLRSPAEAWNAGQ